VAPQIGSRGSSKGWERNLMINAYLAEGHDGRFPEDTPVLVKYPYE
jgi:hypothetical protein